MIKAITIPEAIEQLEELRAGDMVQLSGTIITGRDAALGAYRLSGRDIHCPHLQDKASITWPCRGREIIGSLDPHQLHGQLYTSAGIGLKFMIGKGSAVGSYKYDPINSLLCRNRRSRCVDSECEVELCL